MGCGTKRYCFLILLLITSELSNGTAIYSEIRNLVLNNVAWGTNRTSTTPAPCAEQCAVAAKMCRNGGVCETTKDCNFKCRCPTGYTGYFCDMKTPTTNLVEVTVFTDRPNEPTVWKRTKKSAGTEASVKPRKTCNFKCRCLLRTQVISVMC